MTLEPRALHQSQQNPWQRETNMFAAVCCKTERTISHSTQRDYWPAGKRKIKLEQRKLTEDDSYANQQNRKEQNQQQK